MRKKSPPIGSAIELAGLLGVEQNHIYRLVKSGVLPREPDNTFILPTAIDAYYRNKYCSDEELDYTAEKAKHERVKRELSELELARCKGNLHSSEDVEFVMTDMLSNLRAQLLALPSKMAPQLADRSREFIYSRLEAEIKDRLTELSDYTPGLFMGESDDGSEDDKAL